MGEQQYPPQQQQAGMSYPQQQYVVQPGQVTLQTFQHQQQQPQPQGRNVIYRTTAQSPVTVWVDYNSKRARAIGITQIIIALLCMMFNGIGMPLEDEMDHFRCDDPFDSDESDESDDSGECVYMHRATNFMIVGYGFWCGAFYLLAGILAVAAAKTKTGPLLKATLGLSVLCVFFGFTLFGAAAAGLGVVSQRTVLKKYGSKYHGYLALAAFLLILSFAEIICAIWACRLSGRHLCCPKSKPQEHVVHYGANPATVAPYPPHPAGDMIQYVANPTGGLPQYMATPAGGLPPQYTADPTAPSSTVFVPQHGVTLVTGLPPGAMQAAAYPGQNLTAAASGAPPPYIEKMSPDGEPMKEPA